MTTSRKGVGGRKPTVLSNPFIIYDSWGDPENILWDTEYTLDIRIEDVLVGCARAMGAHKSGRQEIVNWQKALRCYRNVHELTSKSIQDYLRCSRATAGRYVQLIKLANQFLYSIIQGTSGSDIVGYEHVTPFQVSNGYLHLLNVAPDDGLLPEEPL